MNALHTLLPPWCKSRQRGPILPTKPHGRGPQPRAPAGARPEVEVQGGSGRTRHPALHLVPDFCSVQPHFQLYKTGTQEWPNWVLSQAPALNPQLLAVGLAVPGPPPEEAPWGAMPRVPEQGSPSSVPHGPLAAVQPIQPPRPLRVWLAASHSGNCRHPEPSGCFPSAQAVAASAGMGLAPLEPLS